jgi:hypothetical protein
MFLFIDRVLNVRLVLSEQEPPTPPKTDVNKQQLKVNVLQQPPKLDEEPGELDDDRVILV